MASIYWYVNSCSGDKVSGNTQIDRCGCKENYSNDCTPTGYRRTCEKDSNGCYTGYGTQDYASTSECFDCSQKEEERAYIPSLCYSDKTPNWQYISGAYQCTKVSDYSPGVAMVCSGKQQQQDKNLCSDTGGDYRWVDNSAACVKADAKSTTYTCSQLGLSGTGSVTLSIGSSDFCGRDKSTANAIRDNWISTNGTNWAKEHISCTPVSTTGTLVITTRTDVHDGPSIIETCESTLRTVTYTVGQTTTFGLDKPSAISCIGCSGTYTTYNSSYGVTFSSSNVTISPSASGTLSLELIYDCYM